MSAQSEILVDQIGELAAMVCTHPPDGTDPFMNVKIDGGGVKSFCPGCHHFVFRRPVVVYIECFLPCGRTQERMSYTTISIKVLAVGSEVWILLGEHLMHVCQSSSGVLIETVEPGGEK